MKKLIITASIISCLIGCSSSITVIDSKGSQIGEYVFPNSLQVVLSDGQEYKFKDSDYYILDDTLYGTGLDISEKWLPFEGKVPFDEIAEIEFYSYEESWTYKLSISEYEQIERDREKPSAIYVFQYDSIKYLFIKDNYFIDNDTLYGKGQSFGGNREKLIYKKIARSDMVSVQYNFDQKIDIKFNYDPDSDSLITYEDSGSDVYVQMNNGKKYSGELLSVLDDVIILFEKLNGDESYTTYPIYSFYSIKENDIRLIEMREGNMVLGGIIFGGMVGAGIGAAIYESDKESQEKSDESFSFNFEINTDIPTGGCIGGLLGAIVGGLLGSFITNDEAVYEYKDHDQFDFSKLKKYARYGDKKPGYLIKLEPF